MPGRRDRVSIGDTSDTILGVQTAPAACPQNARKCP